MGIYYTATGMMGVRISFKGQKKNGKRRGCHHAESNTPFCAICGAKMWVPSQEYPELLSDLREWLWEEELPKGILFQEELDQPVFYIGRGKSIDKDEAERFDIPDPDTIKAQLRDLLEPRGAWNAEVEKSFGFWVTYFGR